MKIILAGCTSRELREFAAQRRWRRFHGRFKSLTRRPVVNTRPFLGGGTSVFALKTYFRSFPLSVLPAACPSLFFFFRALKSPRVFTENEPFLECLTELILFHSEERSVEDVDSGAIVNEPCLKLVDACIGRCIIVLVCSRANSGPVVRRKCDRTRTAATSA